MATDQYFYYTKQDFHSWLVTFSFLCSSLTSLSCLFNDFSRFLILVSLSSSSSSASESYLFNSAWVKDSPCDRLGFLVKEGELVQERDLDRLLVDDLLDLAPIDF